MTTDAMSESCDLLVVGSGAGGGGAGGASTGTCVAPAGCGRTVGRRSDGFHTDGGSAGGPVSGLPRAPSSVQDDELLKRALLISATYRLHCIHRRLACIGDAEAVYRALEQALKESAIGHSRATACLDTRWLREG
jgi:hypothetical protein